MTIIIMTLLAFLSVGLFIAGIHLYRLQNQINLQQSLIKKLAKDINATSNSGYGVGSRLLHTEKLLKELKSKQQDMISFGSEDQHQKRTYKQANQLAQMGATVDELKHSCELSHGEAELLAHLNPSQAH